jgi:ribosome-binding protein aMBF1 (putative translation factor)
MPWSVGFLDEETKVALDALPLVRLEKGQGGQMKTKFIPVEESFKQWKKDPKYVAAYDALEAEFALASAMIKARADADMTQEQVAEAMGTTQAVVARLESGKVLPSTRTLERFAKATRTRLRISFASEQ